MREKWKREREGGREEDYLSNQLSKDAAKTTQCSLNCTAHTTPLLCITVCLDRNSS